MSFHFQPQADSSDGEEAVDISVWKSGASKPAHAQPPSPPAAAIEIMDELADEINNEEGGDQIGPFQGELDGDAEEDADKKDEKHESEEDEEDEEQEAVPFVSSGFTSVNKPAPLQAPISLLESDDEQPSPGQIRLPSRTRRPASKPAATEKQAARVLVPVIPRIELNSSEADEIIDFTGGHDVVRRVLKERKGIDRDVVYKVEFEDRHVEEVSSHSVVNGLFCLFSHPIALCAFSRACMSQQGSILILCGELGTVLSQRVEIEQQDLAIALSRFFFIITLPH